MKKTKLIAAGLIAVMLLLVVQVNAQRGNRDCSRGNNFLTYLELDENQEAQAQTFFMEMQKTVNPLKLDIREKELQLDKLMISANIDEKAVFAKVEEISRLKAEVQKARMKNKIQLRSILTEDQKVLFDSKETGRKNGRKRGGPERMGKPNKMNK